MISNIFLKMVHYFDGDLREINHFMKVWTYAKEIAELEGLSKEEKEVLEIAAIVHDIACPSLREKYGHCDGKYQEQEGPALAREALAEFDLMPAHLERVLYLVGHHHTYENVDGLDYQILLEADYLVNADESKYEPENIKKAYDDIFKTKAGRELLKTIYHLDMEDNWR